MQRTAVVAPANRSGDIEWARSSGYRRFEDVDGSRFPLKFADELLERSFLHSHTAAWTGALRRAAWMYSFAVILLLIVEAAAGHVPGGAATVAGVAVLRGGAAHSVVCLLVLSQHARASEHAAYCWWSAGYGHIFCVCLCFTSSPRAHIALAHTGAYLVHNAIPMALGPAAAFSGSMGVLTCITVCGCVSVAYVRELTERHNFVIRVNLAANNAQEEVILNQMLPQQVRDRMEQQARLAGNGAAARSTPVGPSVATKPSRPSARDAPILSATRALASTRRILPSPSRSSVAPTPVRVHPTPRDTGSDLAPGTGAPEPSLSVPRTREIDMSKGRDMSRRGSAGLETLGTSALTRIGSESVVTAAAWSARRLSQPRLTEGLDSSALRTRRVSSHSVLVPESPRGPHEPSSGGSHVFARFGRRASAQETSSRSERPTPSHSASTLSVSDAGGAPHVPHDSSQDKNGSGMEEREGEDDDDEDGEDEDEAVVTEQPASISQVVAQALPAETLTVQALVGDSDVVVDVGSVPVTRPVSLRAAVSVAAFATSFSRLSRQSFRSSTRQLMSIASSVDSAGASSRASERSMAPPSPSADVTPQYPDGFARDSRRGSTRVAAIPGKLMRSASTMHFTVPERADSSGGSDVESHDQERGRAVVYEDVSVVFLYVTNLNDISTRADGKVVVSTLNAMYSKFDDEVQRHRVYKVMAIADMYLIVAGAFEASPDGHAVDAARAALALLKLVKRAGREFSLNGEQLQFQIGIHSGEVAGGIIGTSTAFWHIFGHTVNVASRICRSSEPGKIMVSATTADRIRASSLASDFILLDGGEQMLRNVDEPVHTWWLSDLQLQAEARRQQQQRLLHSTSVRPSPQKTMSQLTSTARAVFHGAAAFLSRLPGQQARAARLSPFKSMRHIPTPRQDAARPGLNTSPRAAAGTRRASVAVPSAHSNTLHPHQAELRQRARDVQQFQQKLRQPRGGVSSTPAAAAPSRAQPPESKRPRRASDTIGVLLQSRERTKRSSSPTASPALRPMSGSEPTSFQIPSPARPASTSLRLAASPSLAGPRLVRAHSSADLDASPAPAPPPLLRRQMSSSQLPATPSAGPPRRLARADTAPTLQQQTHAAALALVVQQPSSAAPAIRALSASLDGTGNASTGSPLTSRSRSGTISSPVETPRPTLETADLVVTVSQADAPSLETPVREPALIVVPEHFGSSENVLSTQIQRFPMMFTLERRERRYVERTWIGFFESTRQYLVSLTVLAAAAVVRAGTDSSIALSAGFPATIAVRCVCLVTALAGTIWFACSFRTPRLTFTRFTAAGWPMMHEWPLLLVVSAFVVAGILEAYASWLAPQIAELSCLVFVVLVSLIGLRPTLLLWTYMLTLLVFFPTLGSRAAAHEVPSFVVSAVLLAGICSDAAMQRDERNRRHFVLDRAATQGTRKCMKLLRQLLPSDYHVARVMAGKQVVQELGDVTLLYSDLVGFTRLASRTSAEELIKMLHRLYSGFDSHLQHYRLNKIDTIGDAFIVLGGMDTSFVGAQAASILSDDGSVSLMGALEDAGTSSSGASSGDANSPSRPGRRGSFLARMAGAPARSSPAISPRLARQASAMKLPAIHEGNSSAAARIVPNTMSSTAARALSHTAQVAVFALDMLREVEKVREETGIDIHVRIGLHTGRVVGGIIGRSRPRFFIWGADTVECNRMESTGIADQIHVSASAAARLVSQGFTLEPRDGAAAQPGAAPTFLLRRFQFEEKNIHVEVPRTADDIRSGLRVAGPSFRAGGRVSRRTSVQTSGTPCPPTTQPLYQSLS